MQDIDNIEELSKLIIGKLHRKFKYASCAKTAKGYFDSAKIVKKETERFAKKLINPKNS
jgi:hypothetical protein